MKTNNLTDTKQRAYPVLDSSSMAGSWVEEPSYNKRSGGSGTLTGNWVEERILKEQMANEENCFSNRMKQTETFSNAEEAKKKLNVSHTKPLSGSIFGTASSSNKPSMSNIQSTKFIVNPGDEKYNNPKKTYKSINQKFQNKVFAPKNQAKAARVGNRSKLREQQLLEQAKKNVQESQKKEVKAKQRNYYESTYRANNAKLVELDEKFFPEQTAAHMKEFLENQMPYTEEDAISFYTQALKEQENDDTPAVTTIYGSKATRGRHNFGKNSMFSQPIDEFHRHQVAEYDIDKKMPHPKIHLDPEKDDSDSDTDDENPLFPQDLMKENEKNVTFKKTATINRYV